MPRPSHPRPTPPRPPQLSLAFHPFCACCRPILPASALCCTPTRILDLDLCICRPFSHVTTPDDMRERRHDEHVTRGLAHSRGAAARRASNEDVQCKQSVVRHNTAGGRPLWYNLGRSLCVRGVRFLRSRRARRGAQEEKTTHTQSHQANSTHLASVVVEQVDDRPPVLDPVLPDLRALDGHIVRLDVLLHVPRLALDAPAAVLELRVLLLQTRDLGAQDLQLRLVRSRARRRAALLAARRRRGAAVRRGRVEARDDDGPRRGRRGRRCGCEER